MSFGKHIDEWLRTHHGVISSQKLRELGMSRVAVNSRIRRGALVPLVRGIYVASTVPVGDVQRHLAVCLACDDALLAFSTAGREWNFRHMNDPRTHVLVPHSYTGSMPGVVLHRSRRIDPVDVVRRPDGIRLTSPARTVFDVAEMLGIDKTESLVAQVIDTGMLTPATLLDTLSRLGHPRRPGATNLRAVLHDNPRWRRASQSWLEVKFLQALRSRGVPEPVRQYKVTLPNGQAIRFDMAWPEYMVAGEIDHYHWHGSRSRGAEDRERDRKSTAIGWTTARVSDDEIEQDIVGAVEDFVDVLTRAGAVIPPLPRAAA